jgi:type II secretory pathway component PulF
MLLSRRLSLGSLIELCRAMRHYLGAGLMLRDAFREQAIRGAAGVRPVAARIAIELDQGHNLQHALERESRSFPPMLVALAGVGEETGMLPEVFGELERYFVRQQALRRQFIASVTWPLIQFVMAIGIIALVILVMGLLPEATMFNGKRWDPMGLWLFGPSGALTFLAYVGLFLGGLYGLYLLITRVLRRGATVSALALKVPVLGPCLRALALARFCLALRLTLETGMPTRKAIALSLRATSNDAFESRTVVVQAAVRKGEDLTIALGRAGLFPHDFLNILSVGETSGRLDDVLERQTDHYHGEAGRRLVALTFAASALVWLMVGGLIITFVIRFMLLYVDLINQALDLTK